MFGEDDMAKCPICGGPMRSGQEVCDACASIIGAPDTVESKKIDDASAMGTEISMEDIIATTTRGGRNISQSDIAALSLADEVMAREEQPVEKQESTDLAGAVSSKEEVAQKSEVDTGKDLLFKIKGIRHYNNLDLQSGEFEIDDKGIETYHGVVDALAAYEKENNSLYPEADAYLYTANISRLLGNLDTAMDLVTKSIRLNPENYKAWYLKGELFDILGKIDDALRAYDRTLKLNDKHINAWLKKARLLEDVGRTKDAMKAYKRVTELDNENLDAWEALGNLYYADGDFVEAKKCYDIANKIKISRGIEDVEVELGADVDKDEYKRAVALLKEAIDYMMECKKIGGELRDAEEMVTSIKSDLKAGRVKDALLAIDKMRNAIDEVYRHRVEDAINTSEKYIKRIREDLVVPLAEEMLDKAKESFKENDFRKAVNYAHLSLEEAKNRYEEFDNARKIIQVAWERIKDAKKRGIDVSVAEVLLDQARVAMKKYDYDKAYEYAKKAEETATPERDKMVSKIQNVISNVNKIKSELANMDVDVSDINRAINLAEGRLEKDDFDRALEYAKKAEKLALERRRKIAIKESADSISHAESRLKEALKLGIMEEMLTNIKDGIERAQRMFDEEQYESAKNEAQRIGKELEEIITDTLMLNYRKKLEDFNDDLEKLGASDSMPEIKSLKKDFNEIVKLIVNKDTERLSRLFPEVENRFKEIKRKLFVDAAPVVFSNIKRNIEQLKGIIPDVNEYLIKIKDIQEMFELGNIDRSMSALEELENKFKSLKEQKLREILPDKIVSLRTRMGAIREIGGSVLEAENLLQEALKSFENGRYDEALAVITDIEKKLHDEEIGAVLYELEDELRNFDRYNIDYEDLNKMRMDALAKYRKGDLAGAEDMLKIILGSMLTSYIKDMLRKIGKTGIDTKNLELIMIKAGNYMDAGNIFDANIELKNLFSRIEKLEKAHRIKEGLKEIRDRILEIKAKGRDISVMKVRFTRAKQFLQQKDLEKAEKEMQTLREIVDGEYNSIKGIEEKIKDKLYDIKRMVDEINALGGSNKVKEFKHLFDKAKEEYKKKNYERAMELAEKCYSKAKEVHKYRLLIDSLKRARREIDVAMGKGLDVRRAEELLRKAKPALETGDFDTALEFAKMSLDEVERAKQRRNVGEMIRKAFIKISELKSKGYDVSLADNALSSARTALRIDELSEAEEMAKKALNYTDKILSAYLRTGDILQKVRDLIEDIKSMNYPTEKIEASYKEIFEAINSDNLDLAQDLAEQLMVKCTKIKEDFNKIKEQIQVAQNKWNELQKLGIKSPEIERFITEMNNAAMNGDFDRASRLAKIAWEEAEKTRHTYIETVNLIKLAQSRIGETKMMGKDMSRAENMFNQAISYLEAGRYEEARKYIKSALSETLASQLVDVATGGASTQDEAATRKCPHCGAVLPVNSMYCPMCGKHI